MSDPTRLLIVEDNSLDVTLLRMAFKSLDWPLAITVATDGEKAIDLLKETEPPHFIVLDLNLPCLDGPEVLQFIRTKQSTSRTVVAILSSSPGDAIKHKLASTGVTANCHFTKPAKLDEFMRIGEALYTCYRTFSEHGTGCCD